MYSSDSDRPDWTDPSFDTDLLPPVLLWMGALPLLLAAAQLMGALVGALFAGGLVA